MIVVPLYLLSFCGGGGDKISIRICFAADAHNELVVPISAPIVK